MRLSDLRDKKVKGADGKSLGRVHEVHCDKGRIVALKFGAGSLIERWTDRSEGHRIPWEKVVRVERHHVIVATDEKKASGARSRQGTPRTSRPRSTR